jgi:hypothetical protein
MRDEKVNTYFEEMNVGIFRTSLKLHASDMEILC